MVRIFPQAFLVHEDTLFVPEEGPMFSAAHTSITRLIEGICKHDPQNARKILRERIFTRIPLTPLCEGMIKVVAKRFSILNNPSFENHFLETALTAKTVPVSPGITPDFHFAESPERLKTHREARDFALRLKPLSARSVGAALMGPDGELLAYAWNTHAQIRTEHAEMNLVRSLERKGWKHFPDHCTVVTTLKPCAMCAAALYQFSKPGAQVSVLYVEDDPGPKAKNSVLMKHSSLWKKAGEPEIRLAQITEE
jgi:tRNA(Arg) A34 adenosine deaminase TadA